MTAELVVDGGSPSDPVIISLEDRQAVEILQLRAVNQRMLLERVLLEAEKVKKAMKDLDEALENKRIELEAKYHVSLGPGTVLKDDGTVVRSA